MNLNQKIIPFVTLTTLVSLGLTTASVRAATFGFSGFSITDGTNSYEAEGSFELSDGFSGDFDIDTPDISTTLMVSVNTISGTSADFTFDSSNINFGSSTFAGTVTGNTATLETISLLSIDNTSLTILGDNAGGQVYVNNTQGVLLNTAFDNNVSGTNFDDATSVPEPIGILSSLIALSFGAFLTPHFEKEKYTEE